MSCENVQKQIGLLLDRQLNHGEREHVLAHIETCRPCARKLESMQDLRATMGRMSNVQVPPELTARLRVAASHYRQSVERRRDFAARLRHFAACIRLEFDNMMRPLAVPFAGGLASSFACFLFLLPSLSFQHNYGLEPPLFRPEPAIVTGFTDPDGTPVGATNVKMEWGSSLVTGDEVTLTVLVDPAGQVQDWNVYGDDLTPEMKSVILYSKFIPATVSGQPAWGLKQLVFPRQRRLRS
ncbi:MAG TPA: zf-HC2 domain-containing protein [Candidatus Acidoferrales bacterium]|nr:zf-HC2 domain-containing protein [Candidatus Acidoferrales bacterium]